MSRQNVAEVYYDIPVLPLRNLIVMPKSNVHFDVARKKSIAALEYSVKNSLPLFCVTQKNASNESPVKEDLYDVGTIVQIKQLLRLSGEGVRVLVEGVSRARLLNLNDGRRLMRAEIAPMIDVEEIPQNVELAVMRKLNKLFEDYIKNSTKLSVELLGGAADIKNLPGLSDFITSNVPFSLHEKQELLGNPVVLSRAEKVAELLDREIEILVIENDINERVQHQMDQNQRDYFLREQIKVIRSELEEDGESESVKYQKKILGLKLSSEIEEKLMEEAKNLEKMQFGSAEGTVIRAYLDVVLALPWIKETKDKQGIAAARALLEREHFGLEKVKERILEYLSVKQLAPDIGGQVLCFVGPPGVGKTSIASSIASAMGRKFARVSLGGVRDEADIRGHRKTYIGAMPGRIITALKNAGSKNPVLLLDEVDKMSTDFRGDPASALLEAFDSEQNCKFYDHYVELPFDLSKITFILTANTLATIPRPLLDRMEIIEISSYTDNEKIEIAKRHLIPKQLKKHGLKAAEMKFTKAVIEKIISDYTRESGVRSLEREIGAICRKAALAKVEKTPIDLSDKNLDKFLGAPKYKQDEKAGKAEIGIASGLAWTASGGEALKVEVAVTPGSGKIELTGSLGEVMKESAKTAITFIRSRSDKFNINRDFYKDNDIHIHFPEGAVPKDGPSAGITIFTAVLSALTGIAVNPEVAMTGEISLRGKVLPIGGLKEKTMAALKNGFKKVILPAENISDLTEIDKTVREKLSFLPVSHVEELIGTAFIGDVYRKPTEEKTDSFPVIPERRKPGKTRTIKN